MKVCNKGYPFFLVIIVFSVFCTMMCELNPFAPNKKIETGTVMDLEGNVYKTVKIDNKWWMAENLKVEHYRNGDPIPNATDQSEWASLTTGAYCNYENEEAYADTFGLIYNWYAVDDIRNIAPEGWHVPSDDEYEDLKRFIGTNKNAWSIGPPAWHVTNESGFSALIGGFRNDEGEFVGVGSWTYFWSSTGYGDPRNSASYFYYSVDARISVDSKPKASGCYVRCVKGDKEPYIEVIPATSILERGKVQQFQCIYHYSNDNSTKDVTQDTDWTISPTTAGVINENGLFIPDSAYIGTATITANYQGYSQIASITVLVSEHETGSVTDVEGNVYQTVKIGNQWWMVENLKVTHYRNGEAIPNVTDSSSWLNLSTGAFCNFNNDESFIAIYGRHYNWYATVDSRNIAPDGWHVPTDAEWSTLIDSLGGEDVAVVK